MLQWVRPEIVIPVHGERMQLDAHAAFAEECQVPRALVPSNGSVIRLAPGAPEIVDHIETGVLAVDQKRIIPSTHQSIAARRKLQYTGTVHISLAVDGRGTVVAEPQFQMIGLIDTEQAGEEKIEEAMYNEILDIIDDMSFEDRQNDHFIAEEVRIGIRRFCNHLLGMKPQTTVQVMRV